MSQGWRCIPFTILGVSEMTGRPEPKVLPGVQTSRQQIDRFEISFEMATAILDDLIACMAQRADRCQQMSLSVE